MNPVELIVKKRDGYELTTAEISYFVQGFVSGVIPDYQVAAWAMAIYFQGMTDAETTALTLAMAASGDQLDLRGCLPPGTVIVDKHSTGGVGDKTSLVVGPIVAACGLPVGKMSGRGLSFTGGTIDKLESIAGWRADLSESEFCRQLSEVGLVVAGQTLNLAPADKILYALRDVTGTVPSLPLIASSIMSKKLAAGADAIVLDVKCGRCAFMETRELARELAQIMVNNGTQAGRRTIALITQMDQPLGWAVGNALEVREAIDTLQGHGPPDFSELVEAIASEMLMLGSIQGQEISSATALDRVRASVRSGAALEKFRDFVVAQGGDAAMIDDPDQLPVAPVIMPIVSSESGTVQAVDSRGIGLATVDLGAGRHKKGAPIDHRVGVMVRTKVGAHIDRGEVLCTIHAASNGAADAATKRLQSAFVIGDELVPPLPVVYERVITSLSGTAR